MPAKTNELIKKHKKNNKINHQSKNVKNVSKKITPKSKKQKNNSKINKKPIARHTNVKSKKINNKKATNKIVEVVEYYDLPYRYNETIVKILYQTPNTLFVYWDISDKDRENFIETYGKDFFNKTRPVLIVYNDTMNYSFEVPINDFANCWYLHVNDSKCEYRVELGRILTDYNEVVIEKAHENNIDNNYIQISSSNEIEAPNSHVLFNTNENNTVHFRNIKTNEEKVISLFDIIKKLPSFNKNMDIPYISEDLLKILYSGIFENEDISLFEKISNPSSGSLSSKQK